MKSSQESVKSAVDVERSVSEKLSQLSFEEAFELTGKLGHKRVRAS